MDKIILPVGGQTNIPSIPTDPPVLTELVIGTDKYKLNDKGEAVDDAGKILKTKDEIETLKKTPPVLSDIEKDTAAKLLEKTALVEKQLIEGAEIDLDGVIHKLNKDGNIVDATGKVLKSKQELKTLLLNVKEDVSDLDYVSEIQKLTNLSITSDDGKPVTYENTVQGLAQREQDVFKEGRKLGATEFEQDLFTQFPVLKDVIEHLSINGSLKDFTEDVDYNKITLSDDESQHIDIFTKAKLAQGLSQTEITDMISYYKADKKLKGAAEAGLTYLKTSQTTKATERAKIIADNKVEADRERTEYWNEVNKVLTSKQLVVGDKKFTIPETIKVKDSEGKIVTRTLKDFQDYITKPLNFRIDNQTYTMTQLEYDEAIENTKRTPHHDLFDAYMHFTKNDQSQLIAANASDAIVKKVIKLVTKAGAGGSGIPQQGGKIVLPIK